MKTLYRRLHDQKLRAWLSREPLRPVWVDFGGKRSPYRDWVRAERFINCDLTIKPPAEPLSVCADLHDAPFRPGSIDGVLCTSVLEHCSDPARVVEQIFGALRPGGVVVASVPFVFWLHNMPHDYWRFTSSSLDRLFRRFDRVEIEPFGDRLAVILDLFASKGTLRRSLSTALHWGAKPFVRRGVGSVVSGYLIKGTKP